MSDDLLHPDEALRIVLETAPGLALESVPLGEALGRVLPSGLLSLIDHPPFDKSAMDGFAWRPSGSAKSPIAPLRLASTVAAGSVAARALRDGECARIMTGAPLPEGSSAVQRVEWSRIAGQDPDGAELVAFTREEEVTNVILRGENLRAGEPLLGPRLLAPQDIGILASSGYGSVSVARRPVVGIVSTGDELRGCAEALGGAGIYDSNGPQLAAQARAAGAVARFMGIVGDEPGALAALLGKALDSCDVVIVSGGVSMGDFDYVPRTLEALGVKRLFHRIAMRPGKPTWFGARGDKAVFGLPGNPVSTFVNFEVLVKPHLLARMGLRDEARILRVRMGADFSRRESDRVEFLPARLSREGARPMETATPLLYHGSSMLNVLAVADCLLKVDLGVGKLEEGGIVDARLLRA